MKIGSKKSLLLPLKQTRKKVWELLWLRTRPAFSLVVCFKYLCNCVWWTVKLYELLACHCLLQVFRTALKLFIGFRHRRILLKGYSSCTVSPETTSRIQPSQGIVFLLIVLIFLFIVFFQAKKFHY